MTSDVCDKCWGTGDQHRKGYDIRKLTANLARVTAERDRLQAALEGIRETATNGVLSGEFAATEICAEIFSVAQAALTPDRKVKP